MTTAIGRVQAVPKKQSGGYLLAKRVLDLVIATISLVFLSPILGFIAVAIKLDSKGPVLFKQTRVGRDGRPFTMLKFRSMIHNADQSLHRDFVRELMRNARNSSPAASEPKAVFKVNDDPRVTRVGRILRFTSLDELPQLINVLKGEMGLVGPRPDLPYAVEEYEPWHWRRFEVLPGITGLWQVSGRSKLLPTEMLKLDVQYVDECSLWLDCRILLETIRPVLRMVGSG
jgi:lipopolysaccharide/colanic/teichoic acid biosynthesis glycosyltransferase